MYRPHGSTSHPVLVTFQPAPFRGPSQHRDRQCSPGDLTPRPRSLFSYLIPGPDVLFISVQMHTLGDIRGLLLQSHQHVAGLEVKA